MTDTELVEKYGKLCGHIAWAFVRRSQSAAKFDEQISSALGSEDAEDLAGAALLSLIKCPAAHRHEPPYVKRLIVNAIIKAWRKRLRVIEIERGAPRSLGPFRSIGGEQGISHPVSELGDWFDTQPGPDGLAGKTQTAFDYATVVSLLPKIPQAERIVLELSFGIGCKAFAERQIAKKLGRNRSWVTSRLHRGILRLRESLTSQEVPHSVL